MALANINTIKKETIDKIPTILVPILYALTLASFLPKVLYSFINLEIAIGRPAEAISKNIYCK